MYRKGVAWWRLECARPGYLGLSLSTGRINHNQSLVQVEMKNQPRPLVPQRLRYFTSETPGVNLFLPTGSRSALLQWPPNP